MCSLTSCRYVALIRLNAACSVVYNRAEEWSGSREPPSVFSIGPQGQPQLKGLLLKCKASGRATWSHPVLQNCLLGRTFLRLVAAVSDFSFFYSGKRISIGGPQSDYFNCNMILSKYLFIFHHLMYLLYISD